MKMRLISIIATSMASITLSGCFGDSSEIKVAKKIVRDSLLDGESAQFSDMQFYKQSNYVCGKVNAKNKMGGYVGKTEFFVDLGKSKFITNPDRSIPDSPKAPSYISMNATIDFAMRSAEWQSKVASIRAEGDAYDLLNKYGCTDKPPEKRKQNEEKLTEEAPKSNSDFEITNETTKIPVNFIGNDLSSIAAKVGDLTRNKDQIETTAEYNQRMSVLKFDPHPLDFEKKYMIKLDASTFGKSKSIDYNADKEILTIKYYEICNDDKIYKYKNEKPLICAPNESLKISLSNKSKAFGRLMVNRKEYDYIDNPKYDFISKFNLNRDKVPALYKTESNKEIQISTILVGSLVKDQKNPLFTWIEHPYLDKTPTSKHAVEGRFVPFEIKEIIHFNQLNGDIIYRGEIK